LLLMPPVLSVLFPAETPIPPATPAELSFATSEVPYHVAARVAIKLMSRYTSPVGVRGKLLSAKAIVEPSQLRKTARRATGYVRPSLESCIQRTAETAIRIPEETEP
jgi:hypothetical protein